MVVCVWRSSISSTFTSLALLSTPSSFTIPFSSSVSLLHSSSTSTSLLNPSLLLLHLPPSPFLYFHLLPSPSLVPIIRCLYHFWLIGFESGTETIYPSPFSPPPVSLVHPSSSASLFHPFFHLLFSSSISLTSSTSSSRLPSFISTSFPSFPQVCLVH